MIKYIQEVIVPYVEFVHQELQTPKQTAMAIFDNFKDHITKKMLDKLEQNNIQAVLVPANCTDLFQPMDLSVNKSIKAFCESNSQLGIPYNKYRMTLKLYSLLDKFRNTNQKSTPLKILRAAVKKVMRLVGVILLTMMMIVFPMKKANQLIMREMTRI